MSAGKTFLQNKQITVNLIFTVINLMWFNLFQIPILNMH